MTVFWKNSSCLKSNCTEEEIGYLKNEIKIDLSEKGRHFFFILP